MAPSVRAERRLVREVGVTPGYVVGMSLAFANGKEEQRLAELAVIGVELIAAAAAVVVVVVAAAEEMNQTNPIFFGVLGSRNQCANLFLVGFCRRFGPLLLVRGG